MRNNSNPNSLTLSNHKQSTTKTQKQQATHNLYNIVTSYNSYTEIPQFKKQQQVLRKFVENAREKVLFVFGPSGCGKHMFVNNFLRRYGIPYKYRAERIQQNHNQFEIDQQYQSAFQNQQPTKIKSLKTLITQSITKTAINQIEIYEDFPIPTQQSSSRDLQHFKTFKQEFYKTISKYECKVIFVLNSDIYNKYFIVPKEGTIGISQIVLKGYSVTEIKCILREFVQKYYMFEWVMKSKDILDEIIQISNGDMRKVLLNVYRYTIDSETNKIQYLNKNEKNQYKLKLKNQQRFPLFHLLGKYLYAKRYDIYQKKDRAFTRQQLTEADPPFYFNPVDMFYKSNVPINTFTDLLFENYPAKINSIQDAIQISQIFCSLDSLFPAYIGSKKIDNNSEESQRMYVFMLTWGIILKNKSSAEVEKKFSNFRKSQSRLISSQMSSKRTLLRTYFPYSSISSLIRWGCMVKNIKPSKKYLISDIIRKRTRINNFLRDENEKIMGQQEQQQLVKQEVHDYGNDFVRNYKERALKKEKQRKIMEEIQMEDQSDIDDD